MANRIPITDDIIRPQMLTLREFRPFKNSDEYLWAMKEDLSDWLNTLYPELSINPHAFMEALETGVALCKVSLILIIYSSVTVYVDDALLKPF